MENALGKLIQGSRGTYFITIQNMIEKLLIEKSKFFLQIKGDISNFLYANWNGCECCGYSINKELYDALNKLLDLENAISKDLKIPLLYIDLFIAWKYGDYSKSMLLNDTNFYN